MGREILVLPHGGVSVMGNWLWIDYQGIARTQSPTNKNCAPKVPTFGVLVQVSPTVVQWKGLAVGEPPSWSRYPLCQVSMLSHCLIGTWVLFLCRIIVVSKCSANQTYLHLSVYLSLTLLLVCKLRGPKCSFGSFTAWAWHLVLQNCESWSCWTFVELRIKTYAIIVWPHTSNSNHLWRKGAGHCIKSVIYSDINTHVYEIRFGVKGEKERRARGYERRETTILGKVSDRVAEKRHCRTEDRLYISNYNRKTCPQRPENGELNYLWIWRFSPRGVGRSWRYCNTRPTRGKVGASPCIFSQFQKSV